MRESYLGTVISVAVHSCIVPLLIAASLTVHNTRVKVVEVDFSLIKDQPRMNSTPHDEKKIIEAKPGLLKGKKAPKRILEMDSPVQENPQTVPAKEGLEPSPVPTIVTASDAQGEMIVHGTPATYAGSSGSGKFLQPHGSLSGSSEGGGQGTGQGGESLAAGSKDYNYIRNAIMKNIKYPDRARRLGFEGKVLLSFMVLENGTMREITVINSSGHPVLDESALKAVAMTRIARKVPYRVVVRLPITFRLQGPKDDRT
jgi:protein TonB